MMFADDIVLIDETREEVSLNGMVLPQSNHFKYLGSILHVDGGCEEDVSHKIQAG